MSDRRRVEEDETANASSAEPTSASTTISSKNENVNNNCKNENAKDKSPDGNFSNFQIPDVTMSVISVANRPLFDAVVASVAANRNGSVIPIDLPTTSQQAGNGNSGNLVRGNNNNNNSSNQVSVPRAHDEEDSERTCWICFATDEDNRLAAWVQPCKCRGTTKWVHQSCLYRWIDEKQKGNAMRSVTCQQCQTEYIIVFPHMSKLANILEAFDNLIKRLSPFLAAGIFVGSLYWTAVTYGAVTFLQIVGHKKGFALMENGDPLILLIGLPAIPVGLVLGRMIRWEDAIIRLIRNRHVARKFPLMSFIIPHPNEDDEEQTSHNPTTPTLSDPVSATRVFCGALLLPTISSIVGRLLFESIENTLHRTLLGGLTFITVKGILRIYLKQQQYTRRKKRNILDYTEENIETYASGNATSRLSGAGGILNGNNNAAFRAANVNNNIRTNRNGNNDAQSNNQQASGSSSGNVVRLTEAATSTADMQREDANIPLTTTNKLDSIV